VVIEEKAYSSENATTPKVGQLYEENQCSPLSFVVEEVVNSTFFKGYSITSHRNPMDNNKFLYECPFCVKTKIDGSGLTQHIIHCDARKKK
tara:strand:+ start:686 stop:958 length:273 start_codon:yes stop_codon:yes gene_type:complete